MPVQPTAEDEALPPIDHLKIADPRDSAQDLSQQQKVMTAVSSEDSQPTMVDSPSSISFVHTEGGGSIGVATSTTTAELSEKEIAQQKEIQQLQALARQIEYYFSAQNLANDTYLQTLRNLNDGCVPVSILANFAKVKAILTPPKAGSKKKVPASLLLQEEEARIHAVLQSVNEYTEMLKIHSIDTATGKIATDETPSSALTILAVGAAETRGPLMHAVSSSSSLLQGLTETSTIILRDVDPVVNEAEVRGLLDGLDCPPITRVVSDVANCW